MAFRTSLSSGKRIFIIVNYKSLQTSCSLTASFPFPDIEFFCLWSTWKVKDKNVILRENAKIRWLTLFLTLISKNSNEISWTVSVKSKTSVRSTKRRRRVFMRVRCTQNFTLKNRRNSTKFHSCLYTRR